MIYVFINVDVVFISECRLYIGSIVNILILILK